MRTFVLALAVLFVGCPSKPTVVDAGAAPVEPPVTAPAPVAPTPDAPPAAAPDAPAPEVKEAVQVPTKINEALVVTLVPADTLTAKTSVEFRLRVKNPTNEPQEFCRYHTLFEGLRNDVLEVKSASGKVLDYRGMMAKRGPPTAEDMIRLDPGEETMSEAVDVRDGYAFTAGTFTVAFRGGTISGLPSSAPVTVGVK